MADFNIRIVTDPSSATPGIDTVERRLTRLETKTGAVGAAFRRLFAGIGAVLVARKVLQTVDAYQNLQNRLRQVTSGQEDLAATTERLLQVADRSRTSLESTVGLYSRLVQNVQRFKNNTDEAVKFTENLNKAFAASGLTGTETTAVLIQLSQALASGKLQGDEFRTVMEAFPRLGQILADSMKVPRTELQKLRSEGKITTDAIVDAFLNATDQIDESFGKSVPTLGQSMVILGNDTLALIGDLDKLLGASDLLGKGIRGTAAAFREMRAAIVAVQEAGGKGLLDAREDARLNETGQRIVAVRYQIRELQKVIAAGVDSPRLQDRLADLRAELTRLEGKAKETTKALPGPKTGERPPVVTDTKIEERRQKVIRSIVTDLQDEYEQLLLVNAGLSSQSALLDVAQKIRGRGIAISEQERQGLADLAQRNEALRRQVVLQQDVIEPMNEELALLKLQLTGDRAKVEAEGIYQRLKKQGVPVSEAEKKAIEDQVRALQKARDLAEARQEVFGAQEEANRKLEAYNTLLQDPRNADSQDLIRRKADETRLSLLEGSTALEDGFSRAFLRLKLESQDLASVADAAVSSFADNATSALVRFAETGKFEFKQFASDVLSDLTRIIARLLVVQALSAIFGGGGGTGAALAAQGAASSFGGGRANGGVVGAGRSYLVGERGPELFTPAQPGAITPAPATAAAMQQQPPVVQIVNIDDPNMIPQAIASGIADDQIINVISRNRGRVRQEIR